MPRGHSPYHQRSGATLDERLHSMSIPEPNSGCLLWLGSVNQYGYPSMKIDGEARGVHRVVLERKLGRPLLPGEFACHKCDVPGCIAEDHLFPGTHEDNMSDRGTKGRTAVGERAQAAKLTAAQVREIRKDTRPARAVGLAYGVSAGAVDQIRHRKTWRHVS